MTTPTPQPTSPVDELTPAEYGAMLARSEPPITAEQAEAAALILATVDDDASHTGHPGRAA